MFPGISFRLILQHVLVAVEKPDVATDAHASGAGYLVHAFLPEETLLANDGRFDLVRNARVNLLKLLFEEGRTVFLLRCGLDLPSSPTLPCRGRRLNIVRDNRTMRSDVVLTFSAIRTPAL